MGDGWIYRIYYDSMIDLYSNEYETELKHLLETNISRIYGALHIIIMKFIENESNRVS